MLPYYCLLDNVPNNETPENVEEIVHAGFKTNIPVFVDSCLV